MSGGECTCAASVPMIVAGVLLCATCKRSPALPASIAVPTVDEWSTYRLPPDAKTPEAFNRACRAGRVAGARKSGRVWICSREAWAARERSAPSIARARARTTKAETNGKARDVDADLYASLGLDAPRGTR